MEKVLEELCARLKAASRENVRAIVLYGSAVTGEFRRQHSDLNVLCVVETASADHLEALHPAVSWWRRQGYASPLVFTLDELKACSDIFAIELSDMKAQHRMLYGDDFLQNLEVPMNLYEQQIERELRTNAVRLRQAIIGVPPRDRVMVSLMDASVSSFITLFRHALKAFGECVPDGKRGVIRRAAELVHVNPSAFEMILDVHEGKRKIASVDARDTLNGFVALVERMADEVDRRLAKP